MVTPELGDFGLVRTPDIGGRLIRIGLDSPMNHAFVYMGDGEVMEARPSGAGYNLVENYSNKGYHLTWSTGKIALTDQQRHDIYTFALLQKDIPYNWFDIAALALKVFHVPNSDWVDSRIENMRRLICSQLVDKVYMLAGVHLFDDGRLTQAVTPGDLYELLT